MPRSPRTTQWSPATSLAGRPLIWVTTPRSIGALSVLVTAGLAAIRSRKGPIWSGWMSTKKKAGARCGRSRSMAARRFQSICPTAASTDKPRPSDSTTGSASDRGAPMAASAARVAGRPRASPVRASRRAPARRPQAAPPAPPAPPERRPPPPAPVRECRWPRLPRPPAPPSAPPAPRSSACAARTACRCRRGKGPPPGSSRSAPAAEARRSAPSARHRSPPRPARGATGR